MSAMGLGSRTARIGIAVGADALTAVARIGGGTRVETIGFDAGDGSGAGAAEGAAAEGAMAAAFVRLRDRLAEALETSVDGARVRIALLPPLAAARLIELPPLRRAEAEAVIRRNASRHFPGGSARVVAASPPRATGGGLRLRLPIGAAAVEPGGPWFAAGADAEPIDRVHAAATALGWRVDAIVPAHAAWIAAARAIPGDEAERAAVIAVSGGTAHVIRLEDGAVATLRRVPAGRAAAVAEAAGPGPGRAVVFTDGDARRGLRDALAGAGWDVRRPSAGDVPGALAAAMHAGAATSEFVSPALARERRQRQRGLAGRLAVAAACLLILAGALDHWGARSELNAIRERRAAIREDVTPLVQMRDSLEALGRRGQAVASIDAEAPRWTPVIVELAELLPMDTHLRALHAVGDTVRIDAVSGRAAPAIEALRRAETLTDVRQSGVVERELELGATTAERFTVTARLARDPHEAGGKHGDTADAAPRNDGGSP